MNYCDVTINVCDATATIRLTPECKHANGWYVHVPFLWIFWKDIFVCSDCGGSFSAKGFRRKHK